ncbi:UNVERIFIED_CONTAM: hypothetical protein GTU68_054175 [Idotea baltica]|nr:hypothetical protein [Idotea baltica]
MLVSALPYLTLFLLRTHIFFLEMELLTLMLPSVLWFFDLSLKRYLKALLKPLHLREFK